MVQRWHYYKWATNQTYSATTSGNYSAKVITVLRIAGINVVSVTVLLVHLCQLLHKNGNSLTSSAAAGNQWYLNGNIIAEQQIIHFIRRFPVYTRSK
jgi:hypothetical protein